MANTTEINVTACDNELYILASTSRGSSLLCEVKSGFNDSVGYKFNPSHVLAPGSYDLTFVGLNWGGPSKFAATTTPPTTPALIHSGPSDPAGVVWTRTIPITVGP